MLTFLCRICIDRVQRPAHGRFYRQHENCTSVHVLAVMEDIHILIYSRSGIIAIKHSIISNVTFIKGTHSCTYRNISAHVLLLLMHKLHFTFQTMIILYNAGLCIIYAHYVLCMSKVLTIAVK